jgi:hypothetical protein
MVLALVERERERKVSFREAWHSLKLSGVRTYAIRCKSLNER